MKKLLLMTALSALAAVFTAGAACAEDAVRLKITSAGHELTATLEDNAAARAFAAMLPLTLPMENLYGREMCRRMGAGALPDGETRYDGYEIGDVAYWPPRGSLVILYAQNGERFERVHLGHIDGEVGFFRNMGDVEVTFELLR